MIERTAPWAPRVLMVRPSRSWLMGPLLFVCILAGYLLSYNVDKPTHNADWYIRYQVACSIVERNSFAIHPYRSDGRTGPGVNGLKYSQYTLGQTTALIPLYLLGRVFAGVAHTDCDKTIAVPQVFLTAKLLDPILGALLCVLFFATARLLAYGRGTALALALLLAFGTALWPDVLSNLEHTLESLFLLAAAYAALRYTLQRHKYPLWVAVMGVAAGLVFVTRVAGIIAPLIFGLYLLVLYWRWRPQGWRRLLARDLAIFAAGVLPSIVVNAVFDVLRFGSPLHTGPYPDHSFGYAPTLGIPNLLISPGKGLIWYVPALLLLPLVARPFWRRYPLPTILFGLICGIYLLFYSDVYYWHGDPAWGPRYLYACLPYLILPLGELIRRWRSYRIPLRGLVVGVLAASFLVQFSAATVSYWRHWYYIYSYHPEQVENHSWGQNLNYWWYPAQSPVVVSLAGIYDITQKYVSHVPLLQHPADQRLSNPYESCSFVVYGQASICLTDLEEYNIAGNWNTFTMWWVHIYPWWSEGTVIALALALLAVFLASGGAVLWLCTRAPRPRAVVPAGDGASVLLPLNGHGSNGSENGGHDAPLDLAALPKLAPLRTGDLAVQRVGTLVAKAPALPQVVVQRAVPVARPVTGLAVLGVAALLAAFVYGSIVGVAALGAPRQAAPLIHTVPMTATVRDEGWTYQVLRVTSLRALPGGFDLPAIGHHYVAVTLRIHNLQGRANHLRQDYFALTDEAGLAFPLVGNATRPVAELYHLMPFGSNIPAHGAMDGVVVYQVRDGISDLDLLGPGIAMVRLG